MRYSDRRSDYSERTLSGSLSGRSQRGRGAAGGTVLIVTMWIVLVLAGLVLVFSRSIRVEALASANYAASVKADAIARGGVQYVLSQLMSGSEETVVVEGESAYEAIALGEGYFWVLHPNLSDDRDYTFGIGDEGAKINLNSATQEMLLKLPGMTAELAASIIDWRDEDNEVTTGGAESEYYLLLPDSYYSKNGALETVEEVLLLKGASVDILYGEDTNRNGVLNEQENDADSSEPADNQNGRLDRGIYDYVTVYSRQANKTKDGEDRINVNDRNQDKLSELLRDTVKDDRYFTIMDSLRGRRSFRNIIDFYYRTGLTISEFKQIADKLTTSSGDTQVGLVNVNTAPREVLLCLPELLEGDAEALLNKRTSADETDLETIAWVIEALPEEKAIAIGGHITTQSFQKSADIVSISRNGRAYQRYKVVFDIQEEAPKVLHWKSLRHLGWPLDGDIVATLRSGGAW